MGEEVVPGDVGRLSPYDGFNGAFNDWEDEDVWSSMLTSEKGFGPASPEPPDDIVNASQRGTLSANDSRITLKYQLAEPLRHPGPMQPPPLTQPTLLSISRDSRTPARELQQGRRTVEGWTGPGAHISRMDFISFAVPMDTVAYEGPILSPFSSVRLVDVISCSVTKTQIRLQATVPLNEQPLSPGE